ncbi:MAG: hypothetical protein JXQ90_19085 [Cyclobacteriaceae bacterium]
MKNTFSLLMRGIILGGGFGASFGQYLGTIAGDQSQMITNMMFFGMLIGIIACLGILSNSSTPDNQRKRNSSSMKKHNNFNEMRNAT